MSCEEEIDEPAISEYTAKYCWRQVPTVGKQKDKYEELVKQKINDDYESSTNSKEEKITDPYELLVQQKMADSVSSSEKTENSLHFEEEEQKSELSDDRSSVEEVPRATKETNKEQKIPKKAEKVQKKQPKEKRAKRTVMDNPRLYSTTNNTRKKEEEQEEQFEPEKTQRRPRSAHFLSSNVNNSIKPKVTVYKPKFYSHPEEAPQDERDNLHGPFWVYWPKDEIIPAKYAALRKLIRK